MRCCLTCPVMTLMRGSRKKTESFRITRAYVVARGGCREKTDVLGTDALGSAARRMTDRPRPLTSRGCTVFNVFVGDHRQRHVAGGYCHGMERKYRGRSAGRPVRAAVHHQTKHRIPPYRCMKVSSPTSFFSSTNSPYLSG
jgi:hypothetical protein